MFVLLVLAALAVLVLGLGLTWLRMHARQESKAVVEQVLDLTVYNQLRATEAALPTTWTVATTYTGGMSHERVR